MTKSGKFGRVFGYIDSNGDGKISANELRRCIRLIGGELLENEATIAIEYLDSDGDGLLGFEDLIGLMEDGIEEEKMKDLKEAFEMYDCDGLGFITAKNLKKMLKSIDECRVMIEKFDLNGDSVLSFDEFIVMMK